ncbi:MAG: alanine--tRNA ligase [Mycoplasma sp.]|nr:alanine--tRNA ligase [Mycoplasma sp.]
MKRLTSKELRETWIEFFKSKDHMALESKPLIPINDPSLLWINSGVATLKDFFSGKKQPPSKRIVNSQKSIRTNDIENVGVTSRHHTFFEMLGNFSIGDYFKETAIEFAWEFLTKELEMNKEKLFITYFKDDEDTYNKWLSLGVDKSHLIPGSKKMNFWDMGLGPCGPNTEIFFDRGSKFDERGIELIEKDLDNDRYIEIWNVVFSEFNNDGEGNYKKLAQKNIDTGAGLERIASILQGGNTNFDTDLFLPIISKVEQMSNKKYKQENYFEKNKEQTFINKNLKIIADHMRTVVNAISDGAKPSNVSRGYIIRRLIRRAYRSGLSLGIQNETFLYKITQTVIDSLPFEINSNDVSSVIKKEEELFAKTIKKGEELLNKSIVPNQEFPFEIAFKLFETYGFPIEITQEILEEKGIVLKIDKFKEFQKKHAEASRSKVELGMQKQIESLTKIKNNISQFVGYEKEIEKSKVLKLLDEEKILESIDGEGFVIFEKTPFYATSGGQRHDKGFIITKDGMKIEVLEVFKDKFNNHIHKINGKLETNQEVTLEVDHKVRNGLMRNHSGTHLVFKALREVFGADLIEQLGSDNNEDRLRFDFPCENKPTEEEKERVEALVNKYIKMSVDRNYIITNLKEAENMGAIMTIDEDNYSDQVRVVEFPGITSDLCGGTHIPNTKMLEVFKIKTIENKGSGVFRLEAISSNEEVNNWKEKEKEKLLEIIEKAFNKNKKMDSNYKLDINFNKLDEGKLIIERLKEDNKTLNKANKKVEIPEIDPNLKSYIDLNVQPNQVKNLAISLREKYPKTTFVIGASVGKLILAIASKEKDCIELFNKITSSVNGRGGGSKEFAQGAIEINDKVKQIIEEALNG